MSWAYSVPDHIVRPRERGVPAARQPAGAAHGAAQEARQEVRRTGPDLWGQGGQEGPEPLDIKKKDFNQTLYNVEK